MRFKSSDNNEQFPVGTRWCDDLKQYVGTGNSSVFLCPKGNAGQRSHYAFNARLAGVSTKDVTAPAQPVLVFETVGGWNASGGRELLPAKPRHGGMFVIGFADGHA